MNESNVDARLDEIGARLDHIEAGLRRLGSYTPWAEVAAVPPEVLELLRSGDRTKAVQRYAQLTGVGFATARDVLKSVT